MTEVEEISHEKKLSVIANLRDIKTYLDPRNMDPRVKRITLVKFASYCSTADNEYIPAEIGLVTFSLRDGIIDNYSALIDPGNNLRLSYKLVLLSKYLA